MIVDPVRWVALALLWVIPGTVAPAGDALSRLTAQRLAATTKAVAQLQAERHDFPPSSEFRDYRANLHVHSAFSHDSRGQIDDIVAAAKRAGTHILMFNEHPAPHYDFFLEGHRGLKDGVLLIPGAEMRGFLCFPTQSLKGLEGGSNQEFTDLVCGREGRLFLCHLEERMDWELAGITGTEIYNTHADFKDEVDLLKALRDPLWLFRSASLFREYPQAAYSALLDYPADYLKRYDQLCQTAPHTGVAGNDAHQNVGLRLTWNDQNKILVSDALENPLLELDADNPLLNPLTHGKQPGDVLFSLQIDPYEYALRHVGTHLLLRQLTPDEVWDALKDGRVYVAFDWLCDATGFDFAAIATNQARHELGSHVSFQEGLSLRGRAPHAGTWRLFRNGQLAAESSGVECEFPVSHSGVYRVEVWLDVAGESKPWILANPIYVRD